MIIKKIHCVSLLVILGLMLSTNARAQMTITADHLTGGKVVAEEDTYLISQGCVVSIADAFGNVQAPPLNFLEVTPSSTNNTPIGLSFFFCPPDVADSLTDAADVIGEPLRTVVGMLNWFIAFIGQLGIWLLTLTSKLMGMILSQNTFVQHAYVQRGWPFIQGIANIGFIIALIFIAALTTLQPIIGEVQGGIRRLLPRLVIAALLINFSLIIGAVLIDASRIIMAIILQSFSTTQDWNKLGLELLKGSQLLSGMYNATTGKFNISSSPYLTWQVTLHIIESVILIWAIVIGMLYVTVGLIIRYIALILLLIFSPIAYVALAFPNTSGIAKKWWSEFLKWVMYGPIVIFMLVIIAKIPGAFNLKNQEPVFATILQVFITSAMLIIAAKVGKGLGGTGAAAAMSFVDKSGGWARRNPAKAAGLIVGAATGGVGYGLLAAGGVGAGRTGAKYVGSGIKNNYNDFKKSASKSAGNVVRSIPGVGWLAGAKRDKDGNLAKGQSSLGQSLAENTIGRIDPKEIDKNREKNIVSGLGAIGSTMIKGKLTLDPTSNQQMYLNPVQISEKHVAEGLGKKNIENIVNFSNDSKVIMGLAQNEDYWRDNKSEISSMIEGVNKNANIRDDDKKKIVGQFVKLTKDFKKE